MATIFRKVPERKSFVFIRKEDALVSKKNLSRFAKKVRLTKRKDKDFGILHKVSFTTFPFRAVKK